MNGQTGKVGIFIVGAQKAGTPAFDFYMRQHLKTCVVTGSEVYFFGNGKHFTGHRANRNIDHYLFEPGPQHRILGETTPA